MDRFDAAAVERWMAEALQACGIPPAHAELAAAVLGRTSLRGIDTHGVSRLPTYVQRIRAGQIGTGEPQEAWRDGVLQVDGGRALGQVVASRAIDAACTATDATAMASCVIRRSGHLAALGLYALRAAERGRVAFVCQHTAPMMALPGSPGANIGNNPLAFAAPVHDGPALVFDMASSVAARGHVLQAARDGTPIPSDWAVGPDGAPTTDAAEALRGYLQPMAGHKGLGLALMVEVLTAGLSGWPAGAVPAVSTAGGVSAFMLVINPALCCGQRLFDDGMRDWLQRFLAASGPAARYPGQRQAACEQERRAGGIPIPASVIGELRDAGIAAGRPFELVPL